ncbi:MAG: hypothetical protein R8L53_05555 [Mariprofundales bacterium]
MMRFIFIILSMLLTTNAQAGAFQEAQTMGQAGMGTLSGNVGSTAITDQNVPGYAGSNPPEAALYSSGGAALSNAATNTTGDPYGAYTNTTASFTTRPQFTIDPNTDPMITGAAQIQADNYSYLTTNSTTGCTTVSTTVPATYDTLTCTESNTTYTATCDKKLIVTPTLHETCSLGNVMTTKSIAVAGSTLNINFVCDINAVALGITGYFVRDGGSVNVNTSLPSNSTSSISLLPSYTVAPSWDCRPLMAKHPCSCTVSSPITMTATTSCINYQCTVAIILSVSRCDGFYNLYALPGVTGAANYSEFNQYYTFSDSWVNQTCMQ